MSSVATSQAIYVFAPVYLPLIVIANFHYTVIARNVVIVIDIMIKQEKVLQSD